MYLWTFGRYFLFKYVFLHVACLLSRSCQSCSESFFLCIIMELQDVLKELSPFQSLTDSSIKSYFEKEILFNYYPY